jgi:hypothetical protein
MFPVRLLLFGIILHNDEMEWEGKTVWEVGDSFG